VRKWLCSGISNIIWFARMEQSSIDVTLPFLACVQWHLAICSSCAVTPYHFLLVGNDTLPNICNAQWAKFKLWSHLEKFGIGSVQVPEQPGTEQWLTTLHFVWTVDSLLIHSRCYPILYLTTLYWACLNLDSPPYFVHVLCASCLSFCYQLFIKFFQSFSCWSWVPLGKSGLVLGYFCCTELGIGIECSYCKFSYGLCYLFLSLLPTLVLLRVFQTMFIERADVSWDCELLSCTKPRSSRGLCVQPLMSTRQYLHWLPSTVSVVH